jgi:RHS repeat-associated protein
MQVGEAGFFNYLYQGQTLDTETGLAYNRFRYYAPEEGIYISQDPIGLVGNNPTLYGYVKDTNSWIDPFGLAQCNDNQAKSVDSEAEVKKLLGEKYPDHEILEKPRVYVFDENGNISGHSNPDFMVIDQSGNIVEIADAKNGYAGKTNYDKLTPQQQKLYDNGGEFRGSSRSENLTKTDVASKGVGNSNRSW